MSKSDPNENSYIALLDKPETIRNKMKRAVTDSEAIIRFDPKTKPGVSNLLTLYSAINGGTIENLEQHYQGQGYGSFKMELADALVAFLQPLQERFHQLRSDEKLLGKILKHGAERAHERSQKMLKKVYEALGFVPS